MPKIIEILGTDKIKNSRQVINDNFLNLELRPFFAGVIEKPVITDNGDGSLTLSDFKAALFPSSDFEGVVSIFEITGGTIELIDNMVNFIVCDYNNGNPIIRKTIDQHEINESNIIPIWTAHRSGNDICKIDWNELGVGLSNKIHKSIIKTERYRRESGLKIFGTGTRNIIVEEGKLWMGGVEISLLPINTSTGDNIIFFKHVSGSWQAESITQFNNTQYDNGTDLVTLTNNRYTVNFLYRGVDDSKHLFMLLGQGDYKSTEVNSALPPRRDDLPEIMRYCSIPIGKVIVKKNSNDGVFLSAFDTSFPFTGILSHDDLLDIKLAGEDIDFGHISAGVQSIYGVKTFMETIVGNIDTADKLKTTRTINGVNFDGSENININLNNSLIPGTGISGEAFDGSAEKTWNIDLSEIMDLSSSQTITGIKTFSNTIVGNIDTADKLKTARTINGVSFDGSQNISITTVLAGSLTPGDGISGDVFDGSVNKTWTIDSSGVVMTTGDQTIAGIKTFSNTIVGSGDISANRFTLNGNALISFIGNTRYLWAGSDGLSIVDSLGNTEFLKINNIGYVGIGGTPAYPLHIKINANDPLNIQRTDKAFTDNAYLSNLRFIDKNFNVGFSIGYASSGNNDIYCSNNYGGFIFNSGSGGSSTSVLTITSDGKVGIGTSSPVALFSIQKGTAGEYMRVGGDDTGYIIGRGLSFSTTSVFGIGDCHIIEPLSSSGRINLGNGKNVGVNINDSKEKLHVDNGNLLNSGTHGTSPVFSVSGAGTRMFFYPRKSAFRAGYVNGTQWDDANIGDYSVAMGYNTTASGYFSTAMGNSTTASGSASTAMGNFTTASGTCSTAMGVGTTASGYTSTAMGINTIASGNNSTAMGAGSSASGHTSIAMGVSTVASGDYSTAMGRNSRAIGDYSFAINLNSSAAPDVGANIFRISGATTIGGNVAWTNHSDRKLKEDIREIKSALDNICKLKPSIFKWKDVNPGVEKTDNLGLIAQEVREVYPEVVKGNEEKEILTLEYTGLIAPIIKAIQELSAKIENIENNIIGGANGN